MIYNSKSMGSLLEPRFEMECHYSHLSQAARAKDNFTQIQLLKKQASPLDARSYITNSMLSGTDNWVAFAIPLPEMAFT